MFALSLVVVLWGLVVSEFAFSFSARSVKSFLYGLILFVFFSSFYIARIVELPYYIVCALSFPFLIGAIRKNIKLFLFVLSCLFVLLSVVLGGHPLQDILKVLFFFLVFYSVSGILYFLVSNEDFDRIFVVFSFLMCFLYLIILLVPFAFSGQLMGAVFGVGRLAAGANPNFISYFGFSYSALLCLFSWRLKFRKLYILTAVLGLGLALWGMSRASILSALICTVLFVLAYALKAILSLRTNRLVFLLFVFFGLLLFLAPMAYVVIPEQRLGAGNFESRFAAWELLLYYFSESPFFGFAGWYGSSELLPLNEKQSGVAASAHNAYISILSEIGIVGFFGLMLIPVTTFISSAFLAINSLGDRILYSSFLLIALVILFVLLREMFERNLFYNYMDLPLFIVSCAIVSFLRLKKVSFRT